MNHTDTRYAHVLLPAILTDHQWAHLVAAHTGEEDFAEFFVCEVTEVDTVRADAAAALGASLPPTDPARLHGIDSINVIDLDLSHDRLMVVVELPGAQPNLITDPIGIDEFQSPEPGPAAVRHVLQTLLRYRNKLLRGLRTVVCGGLPATREQLEEREWRAWHDAAAASTTHVHSCLELAAHLLRERIPRAAAIIVDYSQADFDQGYRARLADVRDAGDAMCGTDVDVSEDAFHDIETALTNALSFGVSVQRLQAITGGRASDDCLGLIRIPLPECHGPIASEACAECEQPIGLDTSSVLSAEHAAFCSLNPASITP
jgi:hypothetical protein